MFSHDELVCKMSLDPESLDIGVATATYHDMLQMVEDEKKLRKNLLEWVSVLTCHMHKHSRFHKKYPFIFYRF